MNDDDIFHTLAQNGLSVAICPLPVLGQINLSVVDGKHVTVTRNVADGILNEIADMARTAFEERGVTA